MIIRQSTFKGNDGTVFPLYNPLGLKASITPFFAGDLKTDHDHYALAPMTVVDLSNPVYGRNVIFEIDGERVFWNGQTESQQNDTLEVETWPLVLKVARSGKKTIITTTSYVALDDQVELHRITIRNVTDVPFSLRATTAIPLFGRSADNIRDHRHVTSLLNVVTVSDKGIMLKPSITFDERGHKENTTVYSVFSDSPDMTIDRRIPVLDDFMGSGSLVFPHGLDKSMNPGETVSGYEAIGAIGYAPITVGPNDEVTLFVGIGIHKSADEATEVPKRHFSDALFDDGMARVIAHYDNHIRKLTFSIRDHQTSDQLAWVQLQPLLRRDFGNSYMPHHDYGRGGRGWRDLWQDLLALIMTGDDNVFKLIKDNMAGVRLDGSNATIIGDTPGVFLADRNKIPRVWSDHGAWPLLTVRMFLDETGRTDLLFEKQTYFKDTFTHYVKASDPGRKEGVETLSDGTVYRGTILEHLILQNLVGYHNLGKNGFLRLEDADWNDGLDMASALGESIAFTHMYAGNLSVLSDLLRRLEGVQVELFSALTDLLKEHADLGGFFDKAERFDGKTVTLDAVYLANCLKDLSDRRISFLRDKAFDQGRFHGYYNNEGILLDGPGDVNLTGQAIALLSKTPTDGQAKKAMTTTRQALFDAKGGGYRLNTPYKPGMNAIGRAFGFAYGHKENGAVFSHMAVMYAYGLYNYGLVAAGREAWTALLDRAMAPESKVWAGIPEYFNDRGCGMYPYLTGSASWLLKLLREAVFGIRMDLGELTFEPKLAKDDFIDGKASIRTVLLGRQTEVTYVNASGLEAGTYMVRAVRMDGRPTALPITAITGDIEVILDA
jgi:cellobiose phosphorylase